MPLAKRVRDAALALQFWRAASINLAILLFWRQIASWIAIPLWGGPDLQARLMATREQIKQEHVRLGIDRANAAVRSVGCDIGRGPTSDSKARREE